MVPHEKTFATLDVTQSYKLLITHVSALRETPILQLMKKLLEIL